MENGKTGPQNTKTEIHFFSWEINSPGIFRTQDPILPILFSLFTINRENKNKQAATKPTMCGVWASKFGAVQ